MKKFVCLLMAVFMTVGMFAACTPGNNTQPTGGNISADGVPDLSGKTITILTNNTWVSGVELSDVLPKFKQIEERTGCTIVWETAPGGDDYNTVVQTRLTGDPSECPDIIMIDTNTATLAKYIDEELLFDITKAYDACPNIKALYEEYRPDLKGSFTYSDGGIYNLLAGVWQNAEDQTKWYSLVGDNAIWYRGDIAAELGYTTYPTTMDELYELLVAVKNAYPEMIPMHMWNWDCWESVRIFNSAYGLHYNNEQSWNYFYPDESGKVQYEPALAATKEWLAEMNKWYEEGLVTSAASDEMKYGATAQGIVFSGFYANVTESCEAALKEIDPDAYFTYMPFPSQDGYKTTLMPRAGYNNSFIIVDNGDESQCVAAAQFLDYAFISDYGINSDVAGVEGEGWDYDTEGNFVPNEAFVSAVVNEDIILQATGADIHMNGPEVRTYATRLAWHEAKLKAKQTLGIADAKNESQKANWEEINKINTSLYQTAYPDFYMSDADLETYNALALDLETFTDEMLEKYILGTEDLANFETNFVSVLYDKLQLGTVLEIQQKYYDLYIENAQS